jgi:hypothetical protein
MTGRYFPLFFNILYSPVQAIESSKCIVPTALMTGQQLNNFELVFDRLQDNANSLFNKT